MRRPGPSAGSGPRLLLRRVRRLVDQRSAHRRASPCLASLPSPERCGSRLYRPTHAISGSPPRSGRCTARSRSHGDLRGNTVAGRTWKWTPPRVAGSLGFRLPGLRRVLRHDYPLTLGIGRALRDVDRTSLSSRDGARLHHRPRSRGVARTESHTPSCRESRPGAARTLASLRERRRRTRLVRGAAGVLVVGTAARESVLARGARPDRTRVFANTVDIDAWVERANRLPVRESDGESSFCRRAARTGKGTRCPPSGHCTNS